MAKKRFTLPIFTPGKLVYHNGYTTTIQSVVISGFNILLQLYGVEKVVNSEQVECQPSVFEYEEKRD